MGVMSSIIHLLTNVSAILASVDVSDTGLSLSMEGVGLILGIGMTVALFHSVGTTPSSSDLLMILHSGSLISKANRLSGPGALCTWIRENSLHTSDRVTVGGGARAGRYAGSWVASRAGSVEHMLPKWSLTALASSKLVQWSSPGIDILFPFVCMPDICLIVLYHVRGLAESIWESLRAVNVRLAWVISRFTEFLKLFHSGSFPVMKAC